MEDNNNNNNIRAKKEYDTGLKIINESYFFKTLFLSKNKYEDAISHFELSNNIYKIIKDDEGVRDSFEQLAFCYINLNQKHDEVSTYIKSFQYFKNKDIKLAESLLKRIIDIYLNIYDIKNLVKWHLNIGDFYEYQGEMEKVLENYGKAYDYDNDSISTEYQLKYANYMLQFEKYEKSRDIYSKILDSTINNKLLRFRQCEICLQIILSYLCQDDIVSAKRAINSFISTYPIFENSREEKFITSIISACEKYDIDEYVTIIKDYETISKLDSLKINLLLKIKSHINTNKIPEDNLL